MIEKICEELDLDVKDLLIKNLQQRIDKIEECIKNFLCTEEYINVDGKAIADNYEELLKIIGGKDE